ncbi:hypothetical protein MY11210_004783, partial [Beauveria gryllotalpidicola]
MHPLTPQDFSTAVFYLHAPKALRIDTPEELITIDRDYRSRVLLRRSLLRRHPSTVHGCTAPGAAAVRELYTHLLTTHLPARYPTVFQLVASGSLLHNAATGATHPTTPPPLDDDDDGGGGGGGAEAALRVLGETVEEDLFLLRETPRGHESTAFVCCFPAGFDPSEKLGRLLSEIHAPVPGYDKIAASMERFFGKLEVGKSVKRMNWSVQTHDQLFNCEANHNLVGQDSSTPDQDVDISQ